MWCKILWKVLETSYTKSSDFELRMRNWLIQSVMKSWSVTIRRQSCFDIGCATVHLQVCSSPRTRHILHSTLQHHTKRQLHFSSTSFMRVLWPRPQHSSRQPSRPGEVLLQTLPRVPRMPILQSLRTHHQITLAYVVLYARETCKAWSKMAAGGVDTHVSLRSQ